MKISEVFKISEISQGELPRILLAQTARQICGFYDRHHTARPGAKGDDVLLLDALIDQLQFSRDFTLVLRYPLYKCI